MLWYTCTRVCSSRDVIVIFITTVQEALMKTWDLERGRVGKVQALKEKLDALKVEIEHAERGYDLNKAAELTYAVMPKLQVSHTKPDNRSALCFCFPGRTP